METPSSSRRTDMDKMEKDYLKAEMMEDKMEKYQPWPADTNEKPFMTYDKLMTGAPGKKAK